MAGRANQLTTYGDTVSFRIATADYISTMGPMEAPIVSRFGLNSGPDKWRLDTWPSRYYQWFEDEVPPMATALAASCESDSTTISVTAGDGWAIRAGTVLRIDDEYFYTTAVSTDTVTCSHAFWGSTAATHASEAPVYLTTQADLEGSTDTSGGISTPTAYYNYTQIFRDVIKLTRSEVKQSRYGISDLLNDKADIKMRAMLRMINRGFYSNTRSVGSATTARTFGGVNTFITNNTANQASAALTQVALENMLQQIWDDGGQPSLLVCNAWVNRKISSFYEAPVRTDRSEDTGGIVIKNLHTHFGDIELMRDRWCPTDYLYLLTPDEIGFLEYDAFTGEELPKTGDNRIWHMVGEYGLVVRHDKMHGYIYGISTSA